MISNEFNRASILIDTEIIQNGITKENLQKHASLSNYIFNFLFKYLHL